MNQIAGGETGNSKLENHQSPITNGSMTQWIDEPILRHSFSAIQ
jgi:hypothetical protein